MKMTLSEMFKYQSYLVMVGWVVLMCLPFWKHMPTVVMAIILTICATYAYYIFFAFKFRINPAEVKTGLDFPVRLIHRISDLMKIHL